MPKFSLPAALLAFACSSPLSAHAEDRTEAWRLFVADHGEPVIHVLDAADGTSLGRFDIAGPASLHATTSGETVFAIQRDHDRVSAISTGISLDDHGDHGDLVLSPPRLLEGSLEGGRPVHFVDHSGSVALFFDGDGIARIVGEDDMRNGDVTVREVPSGAPHHGVAVPMNGHTLISMPDPADPADPPVGLRLLDASNAPVGEPGECPGLHGEAASARLIAFGCENGLLIVREDGAAPTIEHLPYPADFPAGRVGTLLGGKAMQFFLGNFGGDAVVLIDPDETEAPFRLVDLPVRRVHFALDPVRARFAYIFTEDGVLRRLDVISGTLTDALPLTEPYSMDGHWSDPRPRVAVTGDAIVVTDPLAGKLHVVDADSFRARGEIAIEGRPFGIVAVGASGASH